MTVFMPRSVANQNVTYTEYLSQPKMSSTCVTSLAEAEGAAAAAATSPEFWNKTASFLLLASSGEVRVLW